MTQSNRTGRVCFPCWSTFNFSLKAQLSHFKWIVWFHKQQIWENVVADHHQNLFWTSKFIFKNTRPFLNSSTTTHNTPPRCKEQNVDLNTGLITASHVFYFTRHSFLHGWNVFSWLWKLCTCVLHSSKLFLYHSWQKNDYFPMHHVKRVAVYHHENCRQKWSAFFFTAIASIPRTCLQYKHRHSSRCRRPPATFQ